jgi:protein gp37
MTKIEWADETWNPIVGCSVVSPGCTHCYAMRLAARLEKMGTEHYAGLTAPAKAGAVWTGRVALAPDHILAKPLQWRAPRRVFVNSMGDLFHEDVPDDWIDRVFAVMALCPQHTFQVLTKRSARMRAYLSQNDMAARVAPIGAWMVEDGDTAYSSLLHGEWPLPNVWLGVSAEDQARADERVPDLLATPAAVRFVSAEPLLGPVKFLGHMLGFAAGYPAKCAICGHGHGFTRCPNTGGVSKTCHHRNCACPGFRHSVGQGIDQIIVGGESGPGARPMHPDWARAIRDQCLAAGVAFFFKQWGAWRPGSDFTNRSSIPPICLDRAGRQVTAPARRGDFPEGATSADGWSWMRLVGKAAAGRMLDGREWNQFPEVRV